MDVYVLIESMQLAMTEPQGVWSRRCGALVKTQRPGRFSKQGVRKEFPQDLPEARTLLHQKVQSGNCVHREASHACLRIVLASLVVSHCHTIPGSYVHVYHARCTFNDRNQSHWTPLDPLLSGSNHRLVDPCNPTEH
jgi:hypothetical protein